MNKTIRKKTFFLYLDTLDLIDVNPFVFDPNFFLKIKFKKEIHSRKILTYKFNFSFISKTTYNEPILAQENNNSYCKHELNELIQVDIMTLH